MFWKKEKNKDLNTNNIKQLIIGKFIFGIKEVPLNTVTVIENSIENNELIFTFKTNGNINLFKIKYEEISDITVKQNVVMSNTKTDSLKETDKEIAMQLLGASVFGPMGTIIGGELNNLVAGYEKIDYNNVWEVTIFYNDKRIIVSFNIDPTNFIEKINHK